MDKNKLQYFGTSLREAGHYVWEINGEEMSFNGLTGLGALPFNPEDMVKSHPKGKATYFGISDYSIWYIEGSCYDNRNSGIKNKWHRSCIIIVYY